jgi:hypothetical protein
MVLSASDLDDFVERGFVRLDEAFSRASAAAVAAQALALADVQGRTRTSISVVPGLPMDEMETLNSPRLCEAYDQLVGRNNWLSFDSAFEVNVVRPGHVASGRWHTDVNWQAADSNPADPYTWRLNVFSKNFALLLLVNLTDTEAADAPILLRVGSHLKVSARLRHFDREGVALESLAANQFVESADADVVSTLGAAGTVYLCHPFLVHTGTSHRGSSAKVAANPCLIPRADEVLASTPVGSAIRLGQERVR